ncbi:Protein NRT1/ PTR FAMILY 4.3, partial [Dichanthelium oligosanthes]
LLALQAHFPSLHPAHCNAEADPTSCKAVDGWRFLDKACVNTGRDGPWSFCSRAKVEETKIVLRMLPLLFSSTVAHVPSPLLVAFTVQQGMTTNTRLGRVHVYPAMLFIIPSIFQMLMLAAYDRCLVPLLRRRTGYLGGITHLQRVGVGFLATSMAPAIAAVVERKRKETVVSGGHQMSLFWLAPQFFLIGVADSTSFVGLLEFFNSEAPHGMKSIGVALFWGQTGMASLLGTLLVRLVNKVTQSSSGHGHGWLEGANLNTSHLDLFYWVVTAVAFLGWLNYLYWAKMYKYRQDPRIAKKLVHDDSMP